MEILGARLPPSPLPRGRNMPGNTKRAQSCKYFSKTSVKPLVKTIVFRDISSAYHHNVEKVHKPNCKDKK